jgi:hypothetical protein
MLNATWSELHCNRRLFPQADSCAATNCNLYSITISARASSVWRDVEASLGDLDVYHKLELGGLLDRDIGGFYAPQNIVHKLGCAAVQVQQIRSIRHQSTRFDKLSNI